MSFPERNEEKELVELIHEEIKKIRLLKTSIYNNRDIAESNDPVVRCLIANDSHTVTLVQKKLEGCTISSEPSITQLKESLDLELAALQNEIDKATKRLLEDEQECQSINKNIGNLRAMMEAGKQEKGLAGKIDAIEKNIRLRFKKEKNELQTIISTLFPDNQEVQDLIARIIGHYFSEGADKYLKLDYTDDIIEHIELLCSTHLFETHPNDGLSIKMAELL